MVPGAAWAAGRGRLRIFRHWFTVGEPHTGRMELMPLTLDAMFWRRVYADRQRVDDERERAAGLDRCRPVGDAAVRAVPLSHAAAMSSARAELDAVARAVENLHRVVHP